MPKRLLDSSLFGSPSLAQCSPRAQDAFPRFILLADDFGCFHANARVLLGRGWPLREDVTEDEIRAWMEEYIAAGMLRAWEDQGRVYAYLTGWDGEHGQKKRTEYHPDTNKHGSKRHAPVPPAADSPKCLKTFPARETGGKTAGSCREDGGKPEVPGGFPSTQSQFLSQAQPHLFADASRAAPGQAPPRSEDHVLPAPTSGREDEPASPAQQPLLAVEVAPGRPNGSGAACGQPARKPRQKPAQEPKDPSAFVACRDMLVSVYEEVRGTKYGFEGAKDARAVSRLLELSNGDMAEVERRWRQALTIQAGFLRANGIAHFASNWNAYPGASPTGGFKPQNKGRATYEDKNWQNYNGEPF